MRATDLIRNILDLVDQVETGETTSTEEPQTSAEFYDDEARRFNQIKDLLTKDLAGTYANSPVEVTASIEAVTTDAGGGLNGPKHPADIRADSVAMYPGANHVR